MDSKRTQEVDLTVLVEVPGPDGGVVRKRLMDLTPEDLAAMAIQHRTRAAQEARRRSSASLDLREELATERPAAPAAQPPDAPPGPDVWEYKDVVIPLGLELPTGTDAFPDAFKTRFELLVQAALVRPRLDGWQPDGPIGLRALGPERFTTAPTGFLKAKLRYESVTLRLKRPRRT